MLEVKPPNKVMSEDAMSDFTAANGDGGWSQKTSAGSGKMRGPVADRLHGAAEAVRERAQTLYGAQRLSEGTADMAHAAADRIDSSASYIATNDFAHMAADLGAAMKRYPVRSLVVAGVFGFLLARVLRRT